jgi:ABC-type sugar transport system ATPase subunit
VEFDILKGEVHAICGENGAGKSTLINILAGNYMPDKGHIVIDGEKVVFKNHLQSIEKGISVVYQERSLVPNISVAENIFVDRQDRGFFGFIQYSKMYENTKRILSQVNLDIDPRTIVGSLSPAIQQMIEVAKALSVKCELLILDEPTATITKKETDILFEVIRKLKAQGIAIIYISHRLQEVMEIADKVTVLKDGKYIGTRRVDEIEIDGLVRMMVGRNISVDEYSPQFTDEVVLEIRNFNSSRFKNVSFELYKGEILSFCGLVGAGRTEVFKALIGLDQKSTGEVSINGKKIIIKNVSDAINKGIGYLTEDRKDEGLFLSMSVEKNIVSASLAQVSSHGFVNGEKACEIAEKYRKTLNIVTPDIGKLAGELSGGNQQKICFAKWLMVNSDILIIDEPTRGVDVSTKAEIYKIIRQLTKNGKSIIVISSDLPETLAISDRIIVMYNGRIQTTINRQDATEENIMHYASGL